MPILFQEKIKKISLWVIIFILLFLAFQFLFNLDFFQKQKASRKQAEMLAQIDAIEEAYFGISPYWLRRYKINLDAQPDSLIDADQDGLNLKQEYENLTDPFDPDTDKDGWPDGEEVTNGYNPLGGGRMDKNKDGLPDFWEKENGLSLDQPNAQNDPDNDELSTAQEFAHGTHPLQADTDGDSYRDFQEISNGYDPLVPGSTRLKYEVFIKKIGVKAPLILSRDPAEAALLEDLKKGVILYPQTAKPGQVGNAVITGHSSNYVWVKGAFNYIFKDLNALQIGDEFEVKMTQQNGKSFTYRYRVTGKSVVAPDEEKIFAAADKKIATLVTCWPLNTNLRRLMVQGELIPN